MEEQIENLAKEQKGKKWVLILIFIIALQVGLRFYLGTQKQYLHIDEGYSYGLMNYPRLDIMDNEDFYNTWHTKEYYEDYLSIGKEEAWNFKPVYENQKNDVHPPLFYLLLRISASFTIDSFSKWTGIGLNIVIFIFSSLLVYFISKELFKDKRYALLTCAISGFTLASLEATMFIRMYELSACSLLLFAYLHIKNFHKEYLDTKTLVLIGISVLFGALVHYYFLIFVAIMYLIFMTRYLLQRNWKNAIGYTVCMLIAGVLFIGIFPFVFNHLFFGYRGQGILDSFKNSVALFIHLAQYVYILHTETFNGMLLPLLLILIIGIVAIVLKKKKIIVEFKEGKIWCIALPTICYFIFVGAASPYQEIRYIIPICAFCVIGFVYLYKYIVSRIVAKEMAVFILMIVLFSSMLIHPLLAKTQVKNVYNGYGEIVAELEGEHNLPTVYLFNKAQNRFLDDLYLFSKIDESYILDSEKFSEQNMQEILRQKDISRGFILFVNEGMQNDAYIERIQKATSLEHCEHRKRLNACDVYYIY